MYCFCIYTCMYRSSGQSSVLKIMLHIRFQLFIKIRARVFLPSVCSVLCWLRTNVLHNSSSYLLCSCSSVLFSRRLSTVIQFLDYFHFLLLWAKFFLKYYTQGLISRFSRQYFMFLNCFVNSCGTVYGGFGMSSVN